MTAPPADWEAVHPATHLVVWVDGFRYDVTIPPVPQLMGVLARGDFPALLPGTCPPPQVQAWYTHLLDPVTGFDLPDVHEVYGAVVERVCGVPVETAMALAQFLTADWLLVDGYHLARGTDLLTLEPRRLFAVTYAFIVEHRFESRADADRVLFPPTLRPPTAAELERDGQAFTAAMAAVANMPG